MEKKILIRDVTLRDGQQSLFATRMNQQQVDSVLPYYKDSGFYALEVWGGAVPDSVMRYLGEDPWVRLEEIKAAIGGSSKLTALSRGRNLFGYNPYPDKVIEGFIRNSVQSGIDIMRIFDALNDIENMKSTIRFMKENKALADCAVCFTVDPKFTFKQRTQALLKRKKLPHNLFNVGYFVKLAKKLEKLGADIITVKDMAGLITPGLSAELTKQLKDEITVPVNMHTHCTPGYGLASTLMSMIHGVDIIDTALMNFAGGPAAPSYEILQIFADKLGIETGVNRQAVADANRELKNIRLELSEFDTYKIFPIEFDISHDQLSAEVNKLFDLALEYAEAGKEDRLLDITRRIEMYFNFPEPDEEVKHAEIPGGMYTNMLAQLKQLQLDHLLPKVLQTVPIVRLVSGCPPLVTPTSQIVGVQAVNCVVDENQGLPHYTNNSIQFVNLVKGVYGKTPTPVDPDFREKIAGVREETPYDTSTYKRPENPRCDKYGGILLAQNEKEELLLDLFPSVASNFLLNQREKHYIEVKHQIEEEKQRKRDEIRMQYERLTPEEKQKRLMEGLYGYPWTSNGKPVEKDEFNFFEREEEEEFPETGV
jgi:oxaloacetate decarboxylase alpha subunit/pyruvate carboxylase subunit B